MADKTIHELTELTTPAADDEIGIWDLTAGEYMRIQRATLTGVTGGGVIATGGFTLTVPATGTAAMATGQAGQTISGDLKINAGNLLQLDPTSGFWSMYQNVTGVTSTMIFIKAGVGPALTLEADLDAYFVGNVSAESFTDRTEFFRGDALAELKGISPEPVGSKLDHDTLPAFARHRNGGRDLGNMISLLIVAVQQLVARIEALEAGSGKLP